MKEESRLPAKKKHRVIPWIWLILALGYALSPLDFVPDTFPIVGWLDDFSLLSAAILNLLQHYNKDTPRQITKVLKYLKWIFLLLAILLILFFGILGYLVFFNK